MPLRPGHAPEGLRSCCRVLPGAEAVGSAMTCTDRGVLVNPAGLVDVIMVVVLASQSFDA
ncbi:hypothetical protein SLNWT_6873 [Streptomyces albus]|uniref:Uncharacterized protein n=1 Tax=Streptomyces albus (strain ATCC 21838 / DSM 41398 / FERM P-419 / JCM 4703 / NBRC 107858) TaxID=1081613 RepID=A0A0B5EZJ7_STRA4|nr:hypothetical protein SLNWT_6873 [Streptomyces albus]AOU81552.1 hypothetical protein SLNHY_6861 [Streptomyces albus]AYN37245.1 hypothetical protein DUI70_6752 [Streptomyces albus]